MDQEKKIRTQRLEDIPEEVTPDNADTKLVRLIKAIHVNPQRGKSVDDKVVNFKYFNAFNYSLLAGKQDDVNMSVGITSPNRGEGKTLVAANLAVSLALGLQKKTVLVDLNIANPQLHKVFDIQPSPGLAEALTNGQIHVSQTAIENLSVLSLGTFKGIGTQLLSGDTGGHLADRPNPNPSLGLDRVASFRDVIYSLEQEFSFIIVDMPAMNSDGIPVLFASQVNGLLVVIDSGKTKKEDVDAMFRQINQHQVIGFVLNRVQENR